MQLGAAYAGLAIELSMLGAAHSAANPLTARFGVIHGQAVGLMLPHVVRFNGSDPDARAAYAELLAVAGLPGNGSGPAEALASRLDRLLAAAELPASLAALGVKAESIPVLAEEAAGQWTAQFNPRPPSVRDFEELYRTALANSELSSR
jgi:alcohol dehydrogenase